MNNLELFIHRIQGGDAATWLCRHYYYCVQRHRHHPSTIVTTSTAPDRYTSGNYSRISFRSACLPRSICFRFPTFPPLNPTRY